MSDNLFDFLGCTPKSLEMFLDSVTDVVDLEGLKKAVKDQYRTVAAALHSDKGTAYSKTQLAKNVLDNMFQVKDILKVVPDANLEEHFRSYLNGSSGSGGDDAMLAAAMVEIDSLDEKIELYRSKLAEAQASMMKIANPHSRRSFNPNDIVVYEQDGVRVTLGNAYDVIPTLGSGGSSAKVSDLERKLSSAADDLTNQRRVFRERLDEQGRIFGRERTGYNKRIVDANNDRATVSRERDDLKIKLREDTAKINEMERDKEELKRDLAGLGRELGSARKFHNKLAVEKEGLEHQLRATEIAYEALRGAEEERDNIVGNQTAEKIVSRIKSLRDEGKLEEALVVAEVILSAEPTNVNALYFLGTIYEKLGDKIEAGRFYRRATVESPGHSSSIQAAARIKGGLIEKIKEQRSARDYEVGIAICMDLLRIDNKDKEGNYFIATMYEAKGDFLSALEHYKEGVGTSAKKGFARVQDAMVEEIRSSFEIGDNDMAIEIAENILEFDSKNSAAIYYAARGHFQKGEHEEAKDYLSRIPDSASAKALLARIN